MYTWAKSLLVYTLLFVCSGNLFAQQKTAQPVKLFFEKVYLHTDRDEYAQGDTLWYKAYVVNGQTNAPIYSSGNLYVELLSKDSSKIVAREILHLSGATANAEFALGDSIASGKYLLRAYTNWMRNFGDNFIFQKEIVVINTLDADNKPTSKPANSPVKVNTVSGDRTIRSVGVTIRFYPESGSLIEGVNSLVAVKAENASGQGVPAKGAILSSSGDTTAVFSCDSVGMGLFLLLPVKGQSYKAVLLSKDKASFAVPQALVKGFSLRMNHRDSLITIIVNANDAAFADITGKVFTLSARHAGKTYFRQQINITGNQTLIKIPDSLFPDGVVAFTLTEEGKDQSKPHCERLLYIHHPSATKTLNVSLDKLVYQSKEKVTVHIQTIGGKASLSLASVDAGIVPVQNGDIVSYLQLQSELKGIIEGPKRYFDTTNINRAKQLDLLLMTQGWRDFVWRRMQDTAIRLSYNLETGLSVSGKVLSGNSGKPLSHLSITLFANNNKGTKLFSTSSDSSGHFLFNDLDQTGDHNVKLSASNIKGEKKGAFSVDTLSILPLPAFAKPLTAGIQPDTVNAAQVLAAIKRRATVLADKNKGTRTLKEVNIKTSRSIVLGNGTPMSSWGKDQSFTITPKDYQYKTLEWWMLHNVKGAFQSQSADVTGVQFQGMDTCLYYINLPSGPAPYYRAQNRLLSPEFFVNGREFYTQEESEAEAYRQNYFPLAIDKFKSITFKHVVGFLSNADHPQAARVMVDRFLLYIYLKDDALVGYNPGVLNPLLNGYYNTQTFYKPTYDTPALQTKSDLRTTIHWQPNITTDESGQATVTFYNADPKGKVRIVVQGVTDKGVLLSTTIDYVVK